MTKEQVNALKKARGQSKYLRQLKKAMTSGAQDEQEWLKKKIAQEEKRMAALEKAARSVLEDVNPEMYAFGVSYYIDGMSLLEAGKIIDRSERQCIRYKQAFETVSE